MKNTNTIYQKSLGYIKVNQRVKLNDNGFFAIADLDIEDGSFHTEYTGIYHLGFDRNTF